MIELRNFDLNLLVAFKYLVEEASVSRAAEKMFLSQSAMSHVLQRIRQQIDDPVLVKTPKGMKPTLRALSLLGPVCSILEEVEKIIQAPEEFSPEKSERRFVIAASDYVEFTLLPELMGTLRSRAPNIEIHVKQLVTPFPEAAVNESEIDVVIGFDAILKPPAYIHREKLFSDRITAIVRQDHPGFKKNKMSLEQFVANKHMLMSRRDSGTGLIDDWLEKRGMARKISLIVPNFLSAPWVLARTDMVLSLPCRMAEHFVRMAPLKIIPSPIDFPEYSLIMAWHPLQETEAAHVWLRRQILEICGAF